MTLIVSGLPLRMEMTERQPPGPVEEAGADVRFEAGTITVLIGPNGAGKTRLLETIAGLREPEGIAVRFGAERLWTGTRSRGRRRNPAVLLAYGYAGQSPEEQLFAATAADELLYAMKPYGLPERERRPLMEAALAAVGWDASWLGKSPAAMSGGERRRLALACLFAVPAGWLLLDEPTAGLDAGGHERLARELVRRAANGQGVLLVSHDSDWSLALADRVLLMGKDGAVALCGREELLLKPELLRGAGMEEPEWFFVARELHRRGVALDSLWTPEALAEEAARIGALTAWSAPSADGQPQNRPGNGAALSSVAQREQASSSADEQPQRRPGNGAALSVDRREQAPPLVVLPVLGASGIGGPAGSSGETAAAKLRNEAASPLARFDARSVWLSFVLLSTSFFMQNTWSGIALSAVIIVAIIAGFRLPLRRWRGAILSLGLMTVLFSAVAGLGGEGGGWWSAGDFLLSLRSLALPFLAMLLGLGLPIAITPLRLRRSLEQTIAVRGRVPAPARTVILTVALLLRFVPVLLAEWERFSRIAVARGKMTRATARSAFARLRDTSVPFMLALFRLAEQVADALESRGVGFRKHPTLLRTERWRRRDSMLLAGAVLLSGLLWWWKYGFPFRMHGL